MEAAFKEALIKAGVDFEDTLEKRLMGSEELYEKCLNMFAENTNLKGYEDAVAARDYGEAFNNIHALKGTAANIGVIKIEDARQMSALPSFEERKALLDADTDRGAIPHLEVVNEALRFDRYNDDSFREWSQKMISETEGIIGLMKSYRR